MSCLNFKNSSRIVDERQLQTYTPKGAECTTTLTVWRKSLVYNCNGFTVIDSKGNLAYRVDNYCEHPEEVVLMDSSGKCVFTMHPKAKLFLQKLSLVENWRVCEGTDGDSFTLKNEPSKKPVYSVKKNVKILQSNSEVLAKVYMGTSSRRHAYTIEGSFSQRTCKVFDESRRVVAEIKNKKSSIGGINFGSEVFLLEVQAGFDTGFAMSLVLVLDQMFS